MLSYQQGFDHVSLKEFVQQTTPLSRFSARQKLFIQNKSEDIVCICFLRMLPQLWLKWVHGSPGSVQIHFSSSRKCSLHITGHVRVQLSLKMCPYNCKFKWIQYDSGGQFLIHIYRKILHILAPFMRMFRLAEKASLALTADYCVFFNYHLLATVWGLSSTLMRQLPLQLQHNNNIPLLLILCFPHIMCNAIPTIPWPPVYLFILKE